MTGQIRAQAPLVPFSRVPPVPAQRRAPPAHRPVKYGADGTALLNVGCGTRTHWAWTNLDFSVYARLRKFPWTAALLHRVGLLSDLRFERLRSLDPDIIRWNAARGLPFEDGSFDVVYHSHVLEHLPREAAPGFLIECRRVLKAGGMLRVVVPDLERAARQYVDALDRLRGGASGAERDYDGAMDGMFTQMTSDVVVGSAAQGRVIAAIERTLRGDASAVGQRHRWMYDEYSLGRLLRECGFADTERMDHRTSRAAGWTDWRLDTNVDGSPYKPESLYMEAVRPATAGADRT